MIEKNSRKATFGTYRGQRAVYKIVLVSCNNRRSDLEDSVIACAMLINVQTAFKGDANNEWKNVHLVAYTSIFVTQSFWIQ